MKTNAIVLAALLAGPVSARCGDFTVPDTSVLRMATQTPEEKIDAAEGQRRDMIAAALKKIDALLEKRPGDDAGAPPAFSDDDQKVVDAMHAWLFTEHVNGPFWDNLQKARGLISANQKLTGRPPFRRDEASKDYAYVRDAGDPAAGVYFSPYFMNASPNCRREVITHEFFHYVVGPQHFYSTKDQGEAFRCPHHLAELVSQIATGVTESCSASIAK